jgi:hypothetical protein
MCSHQLPEQAFTDEEQKQVALASHAALARAEYLPYTTFIDSSYKLPAHIQYLGSYLNALERGDITRLAITMPPQHGKSECTSGKFPAWCLGRDQDRKIMLIGHGAGLAETFSIQNRDTIATNPKWRMVFPDAILSPNVRGRAKWALAGQRESLIAAGVGGSITGLGAWLLLIDDPIKNYEEAVSKTYQESVWNWYTTTARTRMRPDARIIIIMTRWAEDDLLGRALAKDDSFTVVHLPATSYGTLENYMDLYPDPVKRAQEIDKLPKAAFPDPLGRPKGEPLWPDRYGADFLQEQALFMENDYEGLYQGNPGKPEGTKFKRKWFRPITQSVLDQLQLKTHERARCYDLAWSSKERADFTVGIRFSLYESKGEKHFAEPPSSFVQHYLNTVPLPEVFIVIEDMRLLNLRYRMELPILFG